MRRERMALMAARLAVLQEGHDKAQDARRSLKGELKEVRRRAHIESLLLAAANRTIHSQRRHLRELIVERERWRVDTEGEEQALRKRLRDERDAAVDYATELQAEIARLAAAALEKETP